MGQAWFDDEYDAGIFLGDLPDGFDGPVCGGGIVDTHFIVDGQALEFLDPTVDDLLNGGDFVKGGHD